MSLMVKKAVEESGDGAHGLRSSALLIVIALALALALASEFILPRSAELLSASAMPSQSVALPQTHQAPVPTHSTAATLHLLNVSPLSAPSALPQRPLRVLDMEEGSLADWYRPEKRKRRASRSGGGEYNSGTGDSVASRDVAHGGSWSAKLTVTAPRESGTRLFRWRESRANRELYYQAWFYFPRAYTLIGARKRFWNIFQFKSRNQDGSRNDPFWYLEVFNPEPGQMRAGLRWWYGHGLEGPHAGQFGWQRYNPSSAINIPVGRWVKFRVFLRQSKDFDGVIRVWQDDTLIHEQKNIRTGHPNTKYNPWGVAQDWAVNNYSDGLSPAPSTIYVDDAHITK